MVIFEVYDRAERAHYDAIAAGMMHHNEKHTGTAEGQQLTVLAREGETIIGGLWGEVFWGWLKVELVWVEERRRGLGLGRDLLRRAEQEALAKKAHHAYLDTFSFQALGFYMKEKYQVFGELPNWPMGHTRYFLQKALTPAV